MGKKRTAKKQDARGVKNVAEAAEWLEARGIEDIECIVPDHGRRRARQDDAGRQVPRRRPTCRCPARSSLQTITGDYPEEDDEFQLRPGRRRHHAGAGLLDALRSCPGSPTRPRRSSTTPITATGGRSRSRRARCCGGSSSSTDHQGWMPVVAPEIEFYLVKPQPRSRLSAEAAGRPLRPAGIGPPVLFDRRRSTSSTSCSTTSTTSPRRRAWRSTR